MSSTSPPPPPQWRPAPEGAGLVFDDPLDRQTSDDTDEGWGDPRYGTSADSDLDRFLQEKPPHHI